MRCVLILGYGTIRTAVRSSPTTTTRCRPASITTRTACRLGIAYTWSKDLTTQSADRDAYSTYQYNFKMDYGPSTYNQPHTFTASYVYDLPFFTHQRGLWAR